MSSPSSISRLLFALLLLLHSTALCAQNNASTPGTIITSPQGTHGPDYTKDELNGITRFTPSPTISARVKNRVLSEYMDQLQPAAREQIWKTFEQVDILNFFLESLAKEGYQVNDVAVALTAWVTTSFGILEKRKTSSKEDRAVWQQFRIGLAKDPALSFAQDAKKQQIAEERYWYAALFAYQYQQLSHGAQWVDIRKLKADITRSLKKRTIDPQKMTITTQGLVRK